MIMNQRILLLLFIVMIFGKVGAKPAVKASPNLDKVSWHFKSYAPELLLKPPYFFRYLNGFKNSPCAQQTLPFWEGFNSNSTSSVCWTTIDGDHPQSTSGWQILNNLPYEGDQNMVFNGGPTTNSWLISPSFQIDSTKTYKLRYYYRTYTGYDFDMEVLASKHGSGLGNFTQVLKSNQNYSNDYWLEQVIYIRHWGGDLNLAWRIASTKYTSLAVDHIFLEEVACTEPQDLNSSEIKSNEATLSWSDAVNSSWEYYVQLADSGFPTGAGTLTNTTEVTVGEMQNTDNLIARTAYEFFVRAKCSNGVFGEWIGPFAFKTDCKVLNIPFTEGFNRNSADYGCWKQNDVLGDQGSNGNNAWRRTGTGQLEGDRAMYFRGDRGVAQHDDWLISPKVAMNGGVYAITYHYKTQGAISLDNEFEVLLSESGTSTVAFTRVLEPAIKRNSSNYVKRVLYVQGITADVSIAWRVVARGEIGLYIDLVSIEKVDCMGPDNEVINTLLEKDRAKFVWTDDINSSWEYYVQPANGSVPVGSGLISAQKEVTVSRISGTGGVNLQPNTSYEFFVRSNCGPGKNSLWLGPIPFKTKCDVLALPFWEGFGVNSATVDCWDVVDNNNDGDPLYKSNLWNLNTDEYFVSRQSMGFKGTNTNVDHDDWLISPIFKVDATKVYKLKYHFKSNATDQVDFKVLLSNHGTDLNNFTNVLTTKTIYINDSWKEEVLFFTGFNGDINLAWQINSKQKQTALYIDNVFLEEIVGCPEPIHITSNEVQTNRITIGWDDNFGSDWEYVIQNSGMSPPTTNGTKVNKKEVTASKDTAGVDLEPDTEYDFYVRTICKIGGYSVWSGPFKFKTACEDFKPPFWEGFNINSKTVGCWNIVNRFGINSAPKFGGFNVINNEWHPYRDYYEGTHSMFFVKNDLTVNSDDWLLSPTFEFDLNKTYRIKYNYKVSRYTGGVTVKFLASNTGFNPSNFTKELDVFSDNVRMYTQRTLFVKDFGGRINFAWHVKGMGRMDFAVDNFFVEEVVGCPEPIQLDIKDLLTNQVTLTWEDETGATNWEYHLQEAGSGVPTANGVVTSQKENLVVQDHSGSNLLSNTQYEWYVRTVCGNGEHSIWQGPYTFWTLCESYATPFWEGFNTDSRSVRCWTMVEKYDGEIPMESKLSDNSQIEVFEGDRSVSILAFGGSERIVNDWLISPSITTTGGNYVLKYHFMTSGRSSSHDEFGVYLSTEGKDITKFNQTVIPSQRYIVDKYTEQVVFIDNLMGDINLAWHLGSDVATMSSLLLDNIHFKKVVNCREPYYVTSADYTANSIDISWEQDESTVTQWEVVVMKYGDKETATPLQTIVVQGTPNATINGLQAGTAYSIYVRARCDGAQSFSDWSTVHHTGTAAGANNNCAGAVNIPVNSDSNCTKMVSGSFIGATLSTTVLPDCSYGDLMSDLWFEFTATAPYHQLKLLDFYSFEESTMFLNLEVILYEEDCSLISSSSKACFILGDEEDLSFDILFDLTVGRKYYLRLALEEQESSNVLFNVCISTAEFSPVEISPSDDVYTVEQLITDVLVQSSCNLVSNVKYQNGDGSAPTKTYNTLGYFNKGQSNFPFAEGIVLSTNEVDYISRPYMGYSEFRGRNAHRWVGDKDINDAIKDAGGGPTDDKRVTQVEFDFIPIKDSIDFEYLFASNSYHKFCGDACNTGAMFAAWLIDSVTGEGQNLAKVPNTDLPIAINTIRDAIKSGVGCESVNPIWYGGHHANGQLNAIDAPFDFVGYTKPLKSETIPVVIGRKYHIKLAVIDFCTNVDHSTAVFFNSGSFDLGHIDLGADLLVETGNALCERDSKILYSGLEGDVYDIQWYKDEVAVLGATQPDFEVTEAGTYSIIAQFHQLDCKLEGKIQVEMLPALSARIVAPQALDICRQFLSDLTLDLTTVEHEMLVHVERSHYDMVFYHTREDAEEGENPIIDPQNYKLEIQGVDITVFIHVEDVRTGCTEIFPWTLKAVVGEKPQTRTVENVCGSYTLPTLEQDQYYYSQSRAEGISYEVGEILTAVGEHEIFVFQDNGGNCFEEISYKVTITEPVAAKVFDDQLIECDWYTLKELPKYNRYFTEPHGQGKELLAGTELSVAQTVYVYAISDNQVCIDESSFIIAYNDCPIPKGISPNGDGYNDRFDLSKHGITAMKIYNRYGGEVYAYSGVYTDQWYGQNNQGKLLPDGTYYYVVIAHGKTRTGWVQINK